MKYSVRLSYMRVSFDWLSGRETKSNEACMAYRVGASDFSSVFLRVAKQLSQDFSVNLFQLDIRCSQQEDWIRWRYCFEHRAKRRECRTT